MSALRIVALSILAQAVAVACGYANDDFCEVARCPGECDVEAQVCVPTRRLVVEVSPARARIAGPQAHVVFAGAELLVVLLDGEAPPLRLGELSIDQRETLAGWLSSPGGEP